MPKTSAVSRPSPAPKGARFTLEIGDEIDLGDPGVARITAKDGDRVFWESSVYTGWVELDYLSRVLEPNVGI